MTSGPLGQTGFARVSRTVGSRCRICQRRFEASRANYRRGGGILCSRACWRQWRAAAVRTVTARFFDYVTPGEPDACWPWQGMVDQTTGYGRVWDNAVKRQIGAHVAAWMVAGHPRPGRGQVVAHTCDVRDCVNYLKHLFLTTHAGNLADMKAKGRGALGDKNGSRTHREQIKRGGAHWGARIDELVVRQIRVLVGLGAKQHVVGARYDLSRQHVGDIVSRRRWAHVI